MASMQLQKATKTKHLHSPLNQQWQNGTVAYLTNKTSSCMTLDRFYNWSGTPATGSFPASITPGDTVQFTHLRYGQFGSSAAVQYTGANAVGNTCSWIVAWQAPVDDDPPCPPNRVYVTCGSKANMDAISWEQLVTRLDTAPTYDIGYDPTTKTRVDATIDDSVPKTATLLANFKLLT